MWKAGSSRRSAPSSAMRDRKSTRLNSSHRTISYAVFCLKKKITRNVDHPLETLQSVRSDHLSPPFPGCLFVRMLPRNTQLDQEHHILHTGAFLRLMSLGF